MCRGMLTAYRHPLIWASWRSAPFSPLRKWNLHLWIWRRLDWARPRATFSKMVLLWAGNQTRWLQRSFSADIVQPIWSIERKISGEIIVLSFVTVTQLLNQCLFGPAYRELIALAGSLKADPSSVLYRQQINSLLSAKLGYRPSFDLLCFPVTVRSVFLSSLWSLNQNAYSSKVHLLWLKSSHFSFALLCKWCWFTEIIVHHTYLCSNFLFCFSHTTALYQGPCTYFSGSLEYVWFVGFLEWC